MSEVPLHTGEADTKFLALKTGTPPQPVSVFNQKLVLKRLVDGVSSATQAHAGRRCLQGRVGHILCMEPERVPTFLPPPPSVKKSAKPGNGASRICRLFVVGIWDLRASKDARL